MHMSMHRAYAFVQGRQRADPRALGRTSRAFFESIAAILVERASGGAFEDAAAFAAYHLAGLAAFFRTAELKAKRGST
jgi:hypothetical protein